MKFLNTFNILNITLLLLSGFLMAQTANDDMDQAIRLQVNHPVNTFTYKNTIQPDCIDETLTGKCIKYHNDQWFTFNSGNYDRLFINISGQKCRDLYGVQLIILEGGLCQPETYRILDCVSLATQDDIFVALENLRAHQKYWLNVDGYLNDQCRYTIEISGKPKGFSAKQFDLLQTNGFTKTNVVTLQWTVPDSLASGIKSVNVFKRDAGDFRFHRLAKVPVVFNAYGAMQNKYQYKDTLLHPGHYYYRLVLETNDGSQYFTHEFSYRIQPRTLLERENDIFTLRLNYRKDTPIRLKVIDVNSLKVLDKKEFYFDPLEHSSIIFYKNKYLNQGVKGIEIKVINKKDDHQKSYYFNLTAPSLNK